MYQVSCLIAFVLTVVTAVKKDLLPVKERRDQIDHASTVGVMVIMAIGSVAWPVVIPLAALYYWVVKSKKKRRENNA